MDSTALPCPEDSEKAPAEPGGLRTARRALQQAYPGWTIGQDLLAPASTRLIATRKLPLTTVEKRAGFRDRLVAGDLDALEELIRSEQAVQDRHHHLHTTGAVDGDAS